MALSPQPLIVLTGNLCEPQVLANYFKEAKVKPEVISLPLLGVKVLPVDSKDLRGKTLYFSQIAALEAFSELIPGTRKQKQQIFVSTPQLQRRAAQILPRHEIAILNGNEVDYHVAVAGTKPQQGHCIKEICSLEIQVPALEDFLEIAPYQNRIFIFQHPLALEALKQNTLLLEIVKKALCISVGVSTTQAMSRMGINTHAEAFEASEVGIYLAVQTIIG